MNAVEAMPFHLKPKVTLNSTTLTSTIISGRQEDYEGDYPYEVDPSSSAVGTPTLPRVERTASTSTYGHGGKSARMGSNQLDHYLGTLEDEDDEKNGTLSNLPANNSTEDISPVTSQKEEEKSTTMAEENPISSKLPAQTTANDVTPAKDEHNHDQIEEMLQKHHKTNMIIQVSVGVTCTIFTIALFSFLLLRRKCISCVGCLGGCFSSLSYCLYCLYGKLSLIEDSHRERQIKAKRLRYIKELQERQGSRLTVRERVREIDERATFAQRTETVSLLDQPLPQEMPAEDVRGDTGTSQIYDRVLPSPPNERNSKCHTPCCCNISCTPRLFSCCSCTRKLKKAKEEVVIEEVATPRVSSPVFQRTTATHRVANATALHNAQPAVIIEEEQSADGETPAEPSSFTNRVDVHVAAEDDITPDPTFIAHENFSSLNSLTESVFRDNEVVSHDRPRKRPVMGTRMGTRSPSQVGRSNSMGQLRAGSSLDEFSRHALAQSEIYRRNRARLNESDPPNIPAVNPPRSKKDERRSVQSLIAQYSDGADNLETDNDRSTPTSPSNSRLGLAGATSRNSGAVSKIRICPRPDRSQFLATGQLECIPELRGNTPPSERTDTAQASPPPPLLARLPRNSNLKTTL